MDDQRFEFLMSRLLDEEATAEESSELCRLIAERPDRQAELQTQLEAAELIAQAEDELRASTLFVAAALERIGAEPMVEGFRSALAAREADPRPRTAQRRLVQGPWAIAAAAVAALIAGMILIRPRDESNIVRLTALNGSVQWTGDGGRVEDGLEVGRGFGGGTLETMSAESWAVLTFRDGSTVTASGLSMLTIAEWAGKELHLRRGSLSAKVSRQPEGECMVINTPTARLEVLGTQLNVDADSSSTVLSVNEGRVRMTRLVDGRVAEVPADHRIVASLDQQGDYEAKPRPEAVHSRRWDLPREAKHGEWVAADGDRVGSLRAAPFLVTCGQPKPLLVYLTAFAAAAADAPPVRLGPDVRFRIQGRLASTGAVFFGLTMQHPKGGFAGKYIAYRKLDVSKENGGRFNMDLGLDEFHPEEPRDAPSPIGLELFDCWCLTLHNDIGLSIDGVELISVSN